MQSGHVRSYRLLLLMAVVVRAVCGQAFQGTIVGRITDPSGSPVSGANVEVVNLDTKTALRTKSNDEGNYQVTFLLPGDYSLRVDHPGFAREGLNDVRVATSAQVTLNFQLTLGATSEEITVTAEAPLLNTVNADLSQVVATVFVQSILLSGVSRNAMIDQLLTAGFTGTTDATYTGGGATASSLNGGGGRQGGNEYVIDGIPNTVQAGSLVWTPPLDMVEELKVNATMFDATQGHSNGGAVNVTTKSGTNELHGVAYLYHRFTATDANGWTDNKFGIPRPSDGYYQWGYFLGGPVFLPHLYNGRNRTFFSTVLERDHDTRALQLSSVVPTAPERTGNFSQTLSSTGGPLAIYDPLTTIVNGNTATRQPFPGAQIPQSRLSPIGVAVLALYPLPNQANVRAQINGALNWESGKHYYVDQHNTSVRLDHTIGDKQRLFGRFAYLDRPTTYDYIATGLLATGASLVKFINFGFDDTLSFSPSFVGSIRLGVLRLSSNSQMGGSGLDPATLNLPASIIANQFLKGLPEFDLGEGITNTIGSSHTFKGRDLYSLLSTFSKLIGKHSTEFGVDYRLSRMSTIAPSSSAFGQFAFDSTFTQADPYNPSSSQTSGTAMASLLLGLPASGSFGYTSPTSLEYHYLGLFVQDNWKVTPKLTLNFGIRWEVFTPYTERYNRMSYGFNPNVAPPIKVPGLTLQGGLEFAGVNGNPRRGGPLDLNNLGPRFGFAYNVLPKTVIRGGYGIFYADDTSLTSFTGAATTFSAVTPFVGSVDNGATPYNTLANPFPTGFLGIVGSSAGAMAGVGNSISFFDDKRVTSYNQQYQLSIQRELRSQLVVEAAYVGMHSLKLPESFDLNEKPDQYLALGAAQNTPVPNPFLGILPATSILGQGATISQGKLWVRYPQFTSVLIQGVPTGAADYNALQLKAEKRLTHGLTFLLANTFSKLMTNNTTSLVNVRHYRSIAQLDQKNVFHATFSYELPFRPRHANRFLSGALGGWQLSGIVTVQSGLPMSVTQANGRPIRLTNPSYSGPIDQRLGDHKDPATGQVLNPYFDINAFQALPNQYTVTPEPPFLAELRAPGEETLHLFLFKTFKITERIGAQINIQANDSLNSPLFNPPGTNMSNRATFGVIQDSTGPNNGGRCMQFGFRLKF